MKSYTELEFCPTVILGDLRYLQSYLKDFPTKINGEWVTCHALARMLVKLPRFAGRFVVRDGSFLKRGYCHSWLEYRDNPRWIIEAYPIAVVGGPIVVDTRRTPWEGAYIERQTTGDDVAEGQWRTLMAEAEAQALLLAEV